MASFHDKEYKKLISYVLQNGTTKGDRTGTGTISCFCPPRCSFDLSDNSIPLLTIKKMNINSVIYELLWYISGNSNTKYLQENNVKIWNEWADEANGDLGPVYGYLWRSFPPTGGLQLIRKKKIDAQLSTDRFRVDDSSTTPFNGDRKVFNKIKEVWDRVHQNVSANKSQVHEKWYKFSDFLKDIQCLPNYIEFTRNLNAYTLTEKYFSSDNNFFHPEVCVWDKIDNISMYKQNCLAFVCNDGHHYSIIDNEQDLYRYLGISKDTGFHLMKDVVIKQLQTFDCNGFNVTVINEKSDYVARHATHVDQLQQTIEQIKNNPNSRRHIITAWHPGLLPAEKATPNANPPLGQQALPACHFQMQFYVREGHLDLLLNMRSNDLFLGAPFNIVQYSILLHMVAHVTGLKPGIFYHNPADAHVYLNHLDQCNTILERTEFESPTIKLNPSIKNIGDFKFDDIVIENYNCHGFVKAPVAV